MHAHPRLDGVADIETSAARAAPALLPDVATLVVLFVLVERLIGRDRQVTVLELQIHIFLFKARKVNVELKLIFRLADIGLHHVLRVLTIEGIASLRHGHHFKRICEEIIKQTFTKNAGQHKTFLLVLTACRGGFQPARRLLLLPDDIFFSFPGSFLSLSLGTASVYT